VAADSDSDNLDRLWTPDRMAYVSGSTRPKGGFDEPEGCPFCLAPGLPPADGLVVARGRTVFALLNKYPYNPGHLMVCPLRHVADYTELTVAEATELARFTQTAMRVIRAVSAPAGFNLGINQGTSAGAGVAGHLHQHVVPRWSGDTNFMPVIARTKVLPQLLPDTRLLLAKAWPADQAVGVAPSRTGRTRRAAVVAPEPAGTPAPSRTRARATR
jgi:ATP adenylyltransferase